MKLRWIEPDFWNDNFTETGRVYKILCEVEDENTGHTRTFLALTVDAVFNGYDEKHFLCDNLIQSGPPVYTEKRKARILMSKDFQNILELI
uniref:Uncharacterized protein n=1 Tax=Panagrolaimus sp. JU765 TaxID=591449 RepID=A0AC34QNV3_9BILA